MLQILEQYNEIILKVRHSISDDELDRISTILQSTTKRCKLQFIDIYVVSSKVIELLYMLENKEKSVFTIETNKSKLSKYLNGLGLKTLHIIESKVCTLKPRKIDAIVIGGSENSSTKIIEILSNIDITECSVFIIQHIHPTKAAIFDNVLNNILDVKVCYASNGVKAEKNVVYIAPQDKHLEINNGVIVLSETEFVNAARPSISVGFESLSDYYKENLIVILSCGNASDGVDSLSIVSKNKSLILLQKESECDEAYSIPQKAKRSHNYDAVLDVKEIVEYFKYAQKKLGSLEEEYDFLLKTIFEKYEYNFEKYEKELIHRRVQTFMLQNSILTIHELITRIVFNKIMFHSLFLELSINVTQFFREEESFKKMAEVIEKYHKNCYNIKIWSAGCSSGEEVYSTAIILNELKVLHKSTIYATDFNPIIIEKAKNSLYSLAHLEEAKKRFETLKFKTPLKEFFTINKNFVKPLDFLQKRVHFFVHNLEKDSVFNEFDMIECKNVLIYFDDELKDRVFEIFYESLKFGGHLFLGSSEHMPRKFLKRFSVYDENRNIYMKVA